MGGGNAGLEDLPDAVEVVGELSLPELVPLRHQVLLARLEGPNGGAHLFQRNYKVSFRCKEIVDSSCRA